MPPTDFPAGYKPRHLLGEGSMGSVWLAYSAQARGHCAVKVLHLRDDRKGSAERSFNREVRAMARLSHPAVIEILDYGRTPQGSPFVTMEYVPGVSLGRYVSAPWTWARLWSFLDQLLDGLAHAHARDLIHRDLKPGNVLVVPDRAAGGIKLVDFGIALIASVAIEDQHPHLFPGNPHADRPDARFAVGRIQRRDARRLRKPVTLENSHAGLALEFPEKLHRHRRAAADGERQARQIVAVSRCLKQPRKNGGHTRE
jgi:serine/threonine protein kinase